VAAALAMRGRRVLVVDFDLEAPGLTTYPIFSQVQAERGLVHYVQEYLQTDTAPDVEEFIAQDVWRCDEGGTISVMASGSQDPQYSLRFSEINWRTLYTERQGYLFFEDLKHQWRDFGKFDYVLIDSRTGHTDIGGICTRQLPDAVVAMFQPTEQNIVGLTKVIRAIRLEGQEPTKKNIDLHFVMSNVQDLDDEDLILKNRIDHAKDSLQCADDFLTLHHYSSLALLDQSVFVLDHPRSRLTTEYKRLVEEVRSKNLEDRDGALAYVRGLLKRRREIEFADLSGSRLAKIADFHQRDGEVLAALAQVYQRLGDRKEAENLLNAAVDSRYETASTFLSRASLRAARGDTKGAAEDIAATVSCEPMTPSALSKAVHLALEYAPNLLPALANLPALSALDQRTSESLAEAFMSSRSALPVAEKLMSKGSVTHNLVLVLIGQGKCAEAMQTIAVNRAIVLQGSDIRDIFNYAMAEWGALGAPAPDMFRRVVELDSNEKGLNYLQCMAIALHVVGDTEAARVRLARARRGCRPHQPREFSAWSYLQVTSEEFLADLAEIERWIAGEPVKPKFIPGGKQLELAVQLERID